MASTPDPVYYNFTDINAKFEPEKISNAQDEFLNFLEQYWFMYNLIPTRERAVDMGVPAEYYDFFKSANFRAACRERGISLRGLEAIGNGTKAEWQQFMLTEEQLTVANVLLDITDTRSAKKKLADLGISTQKYQAFLRDPGFQNYIRTRAENALGDNQHEAHLALIDRVRSGDMGAIKYYNELTGRYVERKAGDSAAINIAALLMQVLEVIQKHVRDTTIQELVAQDLLQLAEPARPNNQINQTADGTPVFAITSAPTKPMEDL